MRWAWRSSEHRRRSGDGWSRRPAAARSLRLAVLALPVVGAVAVSANLALVLPAPATGWGRLLWWVLVLGAGTAVMLLVQHLARRLLPLALLYDLTLVFPDRTPSRFAVARRAQSVDAARGALETLDDDASIQEAAETALALVAALDAHDRATRGHSERVRLLAELLGEELRLPPAERVKLRWAALLHDLGKLQIHPDLLNKPGAPTDEEWARLRDHPLEGERLVGPLTPWLGAWAQAVGEHHERYDGTGYPRGLTGERISVAGRVVAVADAYETMTARRAYQRPVSPSAARHELVRGSGSQFDPHVVRAFLELALPEPRLRLLAPLSWLLSVPLLRQLRHLPAHAAGATATAAGTGAVLAIGGLAPGATGPAPPEPAPPVAVPATPDGAGEAGDTAVPPVPLGTGGDRRNGADDPRNDAVEPVTDADDRRDGAEATPDDGERGGGGTTGRDPDDAASPPPSDDGTADEPAPGAGEPSEPPADEPDQSDEPDEPGDPGEEPGTEPRTGTADYTTTQELYLAPAGSGATSWVPVLPLTDDAPQRGGPVPNYDVDRDGQPGLRLRRGDPRPDGAVSSTPAWTLAAPASSLLAGNLEVELYTAVAGFRAGVGGALHVDVLDCSTALDDCERIAATTVSADDWGGDADRWTRRTAALGPVAHRFAGERLLTLTLTVDAGRSPQDLLLAFGTADTPGHLRGLSLALPDAARTADPPRRGPHDRDR